MSKLSNLLEDSLVYGVGGFAVGYCYGAIAETSRVVPAQILAIHGVAYTILSFINSELVRNGVTSTRNKYFFDAVLVGMIGTLAIQALRKAKLIAELGTIIFGAVVVLRAVDSLRKAGY